MPRRFTETEMRFQLTTGCLRFPMPTPRPITVTPDPWPTRVVRGWRCRWLRLCRSMRSRR